MSHTIIRPATEHDADLLVQFILDLAKYERMHGGCTVTADSLREQLFGAHPAAEAIIAEYNGEPQGFAIFFPTFSTFAAKPKLYLEDLFVNPEARGKGIGKALLMHLVQIASERNYRAVEWAVLDWNEPAIGFYKKLGAVVMDDWHVFRLTEEVIQNLSSKVIAA
jgi:GNAT superfamily N-acetyltransferase